MVGYQLYDVDREKLAADPHRGRLICCFCKCLVREPTRPTASTCGHTFCRSCLVESNCKEGSSSVAVCPEDGQEFLLQETQPDEQSEEQVKSLPILCPFIGQQCKWYGLVRQLELHLKDYHQKGKAAAKEQGQSKKAPSQHGMQLNPAPAPILAQLSVPGPSGVSFLNEQESTLQNPLISGNSRFQDPTLPRSNSHEQSWPGILQTLMCQQSMDHSSIEQLNQQYALLSTTVQVLEQRQSMEHIEWLKEQLEALGDAVVTGKRDHEQLQDEVRTVEAQVHHVEQLKQLTEKLQKEVTAAVGKVQVLEQQQHVDQNATEELKRQLTVFADDFAAEKRDRERLQEEVRTSRGKVQALEQEQQELKRQLALFADAFAMEKRDRESLQEDVRRGDGKTQALELELEAQKTRCASAQDECVTERCRGIEALNIESGLLQDDIDRLQSGHADLKRSQAVLEARVGRFEDEHPQGL